MNRSNVGNIATNGMQILSVGATTASRFLGKADSALNNLSEQEKSDFYKMRADKMRDETKEYNNKDLTTENEDIDSIMSGYESNSEQISNIQKKINNDITFLDKWKSSIKEDEPLKDVISNLIKKDGD